MSWLCITIVSFSRGEDWRTDKRVVLGYLLMLIFGIASISYGVRSVRSLWRCFSLRFHHSFKLSFVISTHDAVPPFLYHHLQEQTMRYQPQHLCVEDRFIFFVAEYFRWTICTHGCINNCMFVCFFSLILSGRSLLRQPRHVCKFKSSNIHLSRRFTAKRCKL